MFSCKTGLRNPEKALAYEPRAAGENTVSLCSYSELMAMPLCSVMERELFT